MDMPLFDRIELLFEELRRLRSKNKLLLDALAFYADEKLWIENKFIGTSEIDNDNFVADCGNRARKVFKEIK